jgi:hypothetical protein
VTVTIKAVQRSKSNKDYNIFTLGKCPFSFPIVNLMAERTNQSEGPWGNFPAFAVPKQRCIHQRPGEVAVEAEAVGLDAVEAVE